MSRSELARSLIKARTAAERKRLLVADPRLIDRRLADAIREICYSSWTTDPAVAQRASLAANAVAAVDRSDDVRAIAAWVSGIANITRGKFDAAIDDLTRAGNTLSSLGFELESAQTLVPTLLALAITGRYDEAAAAGRRALSVFASHGDHLAAGKIEMNLSNIAARRSQFRDAETHGIAALELFVRAGERSWQTMAENDLANTYMELNDFRRAQQYYSLALTSARSAKMLVTEAEIEASMGNLATLRGEYADALRLLEHSRRKYETLAMPHQTAIADLEIADIYSTLNLNTEAFEIYGRVADAFRRLKMHSEEARARLNLGRSAAALGEVRVARREFTRAASIYRKEADTAGRSAVELGIAKLELELGRSSRVADRLAAIPDVRNDIRRSIAADLIAGRSFSALGRSADAETVLTRARADARSSGQVNFEREATGLLAALAAARGDAATAESGFRSAIQLTEKMRSPLAAAEFSMAFLADKLDAYDGLAELFISQGRFREAFVLTENSRSRSLLDAMDEVETAPSLSAPLAASLADVRTELNWHYKQLDLAPNTEETQKAIRRLERRIGEMTRQIDSLAEKNSSRSSQFDLKKLQKQLGSGRTLVEYREHSGMISAFVIASDSIRYFGDICRAADVAKGLDDLQFQFGACRFGLGNLGRFRDQLKMRADQCLAMLYDNLIGPLADALSTPELIIVPCGTLNHVPFPALFDGEQYLTERFTVSHAPGAAIWSRLDGRERRPLANALLVGFADDGIPLVESEIDTLRKQIKGSTALKGKKATFAVFSSRSADFDVIHLACHGQFRDDNPMFSSLHLADGWITVRDICSLRLRAGLVTLSACETGLSRVVAGNETLGLVRGFLTAGASSLVVSLWTVNDAAAAPLMKDLYTHLQRGTSPAASLQQAQLAFIRRGEHPYLWSPFIAIGN